MVTTPIRKPISPSAGLAAGKTFFFWARLVDRIGNVGAFFGPVFGQSSADAGPILDYLNGKITETQLSQLLLDKIEAGDGSLVLIEQVKTELAAMYSIKTQLTVDGKPYLAGIGIGVENDEGIITSQVLIAASRFAIIDPNASEIFYPFVVQNNTAYIKSAFIEDGTITNAKIGNVIQSNNYVAGATGWAMNKNGVMENNGMGNGYRVTQSNTYWRLYVDGMTLPLVELGVLT